MTHSSIIPRGDTQERNALTVRKQAAHVKEEHAKLRGAEGQVDDGSRHKNTPIRQHCALVVRVELFTDARKRFALENA